nr:serine/threonine-protein kinase WAG1-like [Quercus suber]
MDEDYSLFPSDTDLDFSFNSSTTTSTTTTTSSSSARTSLARSSLTLSFNESHFSTTTLLPHPHHTSDPHWSAIKTITNLSSDRKLHLKHLKLLSHLGTGNLGRVFLCSLKHFEHLKFALKVIDKDSLTPKKLSQVQIESHILSLLDHPFLPTLYSHFDVSHYTCFLIDYCPNGDLHSFLRRQPHYRLPLQSVKFFAAEILIALEYLHALGIVYRDLKPENVLLREDGHVMLSDFDLCFRAHVAPTFDESEFVAEPTTAFSKSCVGTHEYLAPELVSGYGHGNGVDWWAFGIFIYELLYGTTPFKGRSKESTLRNIASSNKEVRFFHVGERESEEGMEEARDLIERLLVKDPRRRLGCTKGATEIKRHRFFDGIKWSLIRNYRAPLPHQQVVRKGKSPHVTPVKRQGGLWRWCKRFGCLLKNNSNRKINSSSKRNYYYNYVDSKSYSKVRKCS